MGLGMLDGEQKNVKLHTLLTKTDYISVYTLAKSTGSS